MKMNELRTLSCITFRGGFAELSTKWLMACSMQANLDLSQDTTADTVCGDSSTGDSLAEGDNDQVGARLARQASVMSTRSSDWGTGYEMVTQAGAWRILCPVVCKCRTH